MEYQDHKYLRVGYLPKEAPIDELVSHLVSRIPGEFTIKNNWKYVSQDSFYKRYPYVLTWVKSNSYHLLFVSGNHLCRFWTDAKTVMTVDIHAALAQSLSGFETQIIPQTCMRKSAPFTHRVTLTKIEDVDVFLDALISMHGLQNWTK